MNTTTRENVIITDNGAQKLELRFLENEATALVEKNLIHGAWDTTIIIINKLEAWAIAHELQQRYGRGS